MEKINKILTYGVLKLFFCFKNNFLIILRNFLKIPRFLNIFYQIFVFLYKLLQFMIYYGFTYIEIQQNDNILLKFVLSMDLRPLVNMCSFKKKVVFFFIQCSQYSFSAESKYFLYTINNFLKFLFPQRIFDFL